MQVQPEEESLKQLTKGLGVCTLIEVSVTIQMEIQNQVPFDHTHIMFWFNKFNRFYYKGVSYSYRYD